MPTSTAMTSAAMTSSSVAGAAVPMSESTGRWVWIEVPQFPVTVPAKYFPTRPARDDNDGQGDPADDVPDHPAGRLGRVIGSWLQVVHEDHVRVGRVHPE